MKSRLDEEEQYNLSGRDTVAVNDLMSAAIDHAGTNKTDLSKELKRQWLLEQFDALPGEVAELLADEKAAEADELENEAEALRERAAELEGEAVECREDAEDLRSLADADLSFDDLTENDDEDEVTVRDRMVEQMARRAENGEKIILKTDADVRDIARDEDVSPDAEWLGSLRSEIEQASDVDAHDLDIKINALGL